MNTQIIQAINQGKIIEFQYAGETRIVEPHCYGETAKNNPVLRAYQIRGFSSTHPIGWKLFSMSKVDNIRILDETFSVRYEDGYQQNDKVMSIIYKAIQ